MEVIVLKATLNRLRRLAKNPENVSVVRSLCQPLTMKEYEALTPRLKKALKVEFCKRDQRISFTSTFTGGQEIWIHSKYPAPDWY